MNNVDLGPVAAAMIVFVVPIMVKIGDIYKNTVKSQSALKWTPLVLLFVAFVLTFLYNTGWDQGLNVAQLVMISIVITVGSLAGYETAKSSAVTTKKINNGTINQ